MVSFAKGRRAWGECQRSGQRLLRRRMVKDGYYKGMLVHPDWLEHEHPQDKPLSQRQLNDPVVIRKPAPRLDKKYDTVNCEVYFNEITMQRKEPVAINYAIGAFTVTVS